MSVVSISSRTALAFGAAPVRSVRKPRRMLESESVTDSVVVQSDPAKPAWS
jgi:hypothetical protein